MPAVKLKEATMKRLNTLYEALFLENGHVAQTVASQASWDFKVNAVLDRLEETCERRMKRSNSIT